LENQYQKLLLEYKSYLQGKKVGLFCNQVSFDFSTGKYLFQLLPELSELLTVFIPEHGLFTEQQDQVAIEDTAYYHSLEPSVRFESLYRKTENKIGDIYDHLKGLDTLIIDIQDVGVRYYTYITTIGAFFEVLKAYELPVSVIVIDKPNPAGRQVEGTMLNKEYSSLIGLTGLPHRYGLTIGELCLFQKTQLDGQFSLEIIKTSSDTMPINPSPNIPAKATCQIFSGQCLLEGTNLSEGRGTTRPFEIFGAPFLRNLPQNWVVDWNNNNPIAVLRPLMFVPTFHKYKDEICYGFQLHPVKQMHSLMYSLKMLRSLHQNAKGFNWLEGPYEAGSDRPAIELLAGDEDLLYFLDGGSNVDVISNKLKEEETRWISLARPYLLYSDPLFSMYNS
jgi:uncharacterized protein YbbC (DUF1343 family)